MPEKVPGEPGPPSSRWIPTRAKAINIALGYFIFGSLWIFCSGWALHHFISNGALADRLEYFKGWFFVTVTALLLGWVLNRRFREIRRASQELGEKERRLRIIGDNLPDSYVYQYTRDDAGKEYFTYVSAGVERVNGVTPVEVLRNPACLLEQIDPAQRAAYAAAVTESAAKLSNGDVELRMRLPDGRERLVRVHSRPSRSPEGQIYWDGLATDITLRKQQEEARDQAEKALRENQRLLQTVINLVPHPIFAKDRQSRHLLVNEACAAFNGLTPEQMLGKNDLDFVADRAQAEAFMRDDREVIDGGRPKYIPEEHLTNAAGQTRILQTNKIPFASPEAGPSLLGAAVDITDLKRSEQNYREIFNATHEAIFLHDAATGAVMDVNEAMLRMYGYATKDEFLLDKSMNLISGPPPFTMEEGFRRIRRAVDQGPQVFEWLSRKRNGEELWVEVSLRNTQIGGEGRVLAVVRDITQRKAQALQIERLTRLYATLSQVNQSIVHSQTDAELFDNICGVMLNQGKFLGVRIGEWLGSGGPLAIKAQRFQSCHLPDVLPTQGCHIMAETLQTGCAAICNRCGDDLCSFCRHAASPLGTVQSCASFPLSLQGRTWGVLSVCSVEPEFFQAGEVRLLEEITANLAFAMDRLQGETRRRQAEEALRELNRTLDQRVQDRTAELRASNEELDSFAYAVSHDLRAPLRAMSGFSQALQEDFAANLPSAAKEYLKHIQVGSRQMGELIDGLLRLSRSIRGTLQRDSVDISALAARLLADLQRADPHRVVTIVVEPDLQVNGDGRLLEVALTNLLGNAWKYTAHTPAPCIRVHGRTEAGEITIGVTDNGAGFDMKHSARLFQPFQRLHREDEFAGLGIGLATVQRIIRRHGGAINGTGAPGAGATFSFTLPKS